MSSEIHCDMAGVLDLLSSLVLCIPSTRNVRLLLSQLTALARTLCLLLERSIGSSDLRVPAYSAGTPSPYDTYYENVNISDIPWNNLMAGYGGSA